jgi:hypothetical protein
VGVVEVLEVLILQWALEPGSGKQLSATFQKPTEPAFLVQQQSAHVAGISFLAEVVQGV